MCEVTFYFINLIDYGQYLHLPSLVQTVGLCILVFVSVGGYCIEAFVNMSLRFCSLLKPITGLSLNRLPQSGLLLIIFQFLCIMFLISGFDGL